MRCAALRLTGASILVALGIAACGSSGSSPDPQVLAGSAGAAGVGGSAANAGSAGKGGAGGTAGAAGNAGTSGKAGAGGASGTSGTAGGGGAGADAGVGDGGGAGGADTGLAGTAGGDSGVAGTGGGSCTNATDCDDKVYCNGAEQCEQNTCVPGTPPKCDDSILCTEDFCDLQTDACSHSPSDQKCSDGIFCNGTETCNPTQGDPTTGCVAGKAVTCADGIDCTSDTCDEVVKACVYTPNASLCQDTSYCNGAELCVSGVGCGPGTPIDCDDGVACTNDACSDTSKSCTHTPNNAFCDDGLHCNGLETCANAGSANGCAPGKAVTCTDDGVACTVDVCDEVAQGCVHNPDNTKCAAGEFCVPGATPPGCTTAQPCSNASQCDDGNLCNGVETCNVTCQPGTPVDCQDAHLCTIDSCDPITGQCSHTPKSSVCDDGLSCNGVETCSDTLGCQPGTPVNCNDSVDCTVDQCLEPNGACQHTLDSTSCDDGKLCNGKEECTLTGCVAGTPHVCAPDGIACTNDLCDTTLDACTYVADDTKCACGQTCNPSQGGCGNWCQITACSNGKVYQCGDCLDNDGDCSVDGKDTQCLGPCDTREDSGPSQGSGCFFAPPPGQFQPELDCAWNGPPASGPYANYNDVVMTPVVINLTDDNADGKVDLGDIPDIAFVSYRLQEDGCCNVNGVLRVLSGRCNGTGMTLHYSVGATEIQAQTGVAGIWLDNSGGLAAGDLDNDGFPEIVGSIKGGGTIAFGHDGTVKWMQQAQPKGNNWMAASQPAIADLDADGFPEVIQGRVVLNGQTGAVKWTGSAGVGINGFLGPVSSVADPDLDGKLNVLAGNTMYDHNGTALWTRSFTLASTSSNCGAGTRCDGFTATGNFDADQQGEVVIVRIGQIHIVNHDGSYLQVNGENAIINIPKTTCSFNEGGPPTIADFDGDGRAEIGVAGADYYVVADLDCFATPVPAGCDSKGIRWKVANDDCSSRVTGSSVFDFDGDGNAEVIYNDETNFRIFDGATGATLVQVTNHSHTRLEMPIVADVDNDGNAEVVFIENAWNGSTQGIRIWADKNDSWVATRRIWNQHSYHVTNVSETGVIPKGESPNWLHASTSTVSGVMNNFRQNLPEFDVLSAPDLTLVVTWSHANCPASVSLQGKVCNQGDLQVGPGVPVTFWDAATQTPIVCSNAPVTTTVSLAPGQCETVTCNAPKNVPAIVRGCTDNAGAACTSGGNNECNELNNAANVSVASCPDT